MYYKLIKPRGYQAQISLINEKTGNTAQIGTLNSQKLYILREAGHLAGESIADVLQRDLILVLKEDTAKELLATAMNMKHPKRKTKDAQTTNNSNSIVNALDIFLEFAN